ncbi:MAG: hypothetical protein R2755_02160 [Acidimicrobiales bacterium]
MVPPPLGSSVPPPPPPRGTAAFLPPPPYLPPPPVAPETAAAASSPRPARLLVLVALITVVALVGIGGLVFSRGGGPAGPSHPEVWDPRVTELVAFVERERGLTFEHPVYIDFLPPEDIARDLRAEVGSVTGEMREYAALQASELRALGLVSGDVDLLASAGSLSAEGVVAFYDPVAERITAPDVELDARQRSILVHELTHVLQDQHFQLDVLQQQAAAPDTLRALAEGDAGRIEARYLASLPAEEQAAVQARNDADYEAYRDAIAQIPPALDAFQAAPYVLGGGDGQHPGGSRRSAGHRRHVRAPAGVRRSADRSQPLSRQRHRGAGVPADGGGRRDRARRGQPRPADALPHAGQQHRCGHRHQRCLRLGRRRLCDGPQRRSGLHADLLPGRYR